ncbi:MAG: hypothetical protein AAF939_05410 [Planctomycetota bacterium]
MMQNNEHPQNPYTTPGKQATQNDRGEESFGKPTNPGRWMVVLFSVLIGWALLIAFGSLWRPEGAEVGGRTDFRKPLFVIGTMALFLTVWLFALKSRNRNRNDSDQIKS